MEFEKAYNEFISDHVSKRKGERLRRLTEGHAHSEIMFLEHVWWPAFGHFRQLHPEYEVYDFRDGSRFLDFAVIGPNGRNAIEIDGYGPHWKNISRWQFSDQRHRQNHLIIDGWLILRFAYDDVNEKPRQCQQELQQLVGRLYGEASPSDELSPMEKEVIRLALRLCRPLKPKDLCEHLKIGERQAYKLLHNLAEKKWLLPDGGSVRIRKYRLDTKGRSVLF